MTTPELYWRDQLVGKMIAFNPREAGTRILYSIQDIWKDNEFLGTAVIEQDQHGKRIVDMFPSHDMANTERARMQNQHDRGQEDLTATAGSDPTKKTFKPQQTGGGSRCPRCGSTQVKEVGPGEQEGPFRCLSCDNWWDTGKDASRKIAGAFYIYNSDDEAVAGPYDSYEEGTTALNVARVTDIPAGEEDDYYVAAQSGQAGEDEDLWSESRKTADNFGPGECPWCHKHVSHVYRHLEEEHWGTQRVDRDNSGEVERYAFIHVPPFDKLVSEGQNPYMDRDQNPYMVSQQPQTTPVTTRPRTPPRPSNAYGNPGQPEQPQYPDYDPADDAEERRQKAKNPQLRGEAPQQIIQGFTKLKSASVFPDSDLDDYDVFDLAEALNVIAHDFGLYAVKTRLDAAGFRAGPGRDTYGALEEMGKVAYDEMNELAEFDADPYSVPDWAASVLDYIENYKSEGSRKHEHEVAHHQGDGSKLAAEVRVKKWANARDGEFAVLWKKAVDAARKAYDEAEPARMIVQQHENPLDDTSPVIEQYTNQGRGYEPQGYAWCKLRPANSPFARWIKRQGYARTDSYSGGLHITAPGSSYERRYAYARAMAEVFRDAGLTAYPDGRLD